MENILKNIVQLSNNEGITISALEKKIGASKGVLSRAVAKSTDIQSKWLSVLVDNYPQYSAEWLLTGKGSMLKESTKATKALDGIPLVVPTAIGGFGNNHFAIAERDVKDYYVIPKFRHKKIDFMIEVEGSSMYPKYNSGDVVACKIIKENSFIQWNKTHVVATRDQGIIIKRIKKGQDDTHLCMVSDNHNYDPFEVPKSEITGIALVIGVIRLE